MRYTTTRPVSFRRMFYTLFVCPVSLSLSYLMLHSLFFFPFSHSLFITVVYMFITVVYISCKAAQRLAI